MLNCFSNIDNKRDFTEEKGQYEYVFIPLFLSLSLSHSFFLSLSLSLSLSLCLSTSVILLHCFSLSFHKWICVSVLIWDHCISSCISIKLILMNKLREWITLSPCLSLSFSSLSLPLHSVSLSLCFFSLSLIFSVCLFVCLSVYWSLSIYIWSYA